MDKKRRAERYGHRAETLAALYLRCKGYRILAMRYRNRLGEIDLVACKRDVVAVVEVKARRSMSQCHGSVPPWKQRKLYLAAQGLLAGYGKIAGQPADATIRFDVIWIARGCWPHHIKDAWRP